MSTTAAPANAKPAAWSAADSLGHAVWRRHAWANAAGKLDFRVPLRTVGMADIYDRHLSFVRRMLDAAERPQGSHLGKGLPIVIGRRVAPAGTSPRVYSAPGNVAQVVNIAVETAAPTAHVLSSNLEAPATVSVASGETEAAAPQPLETRGGEFRLSRAVAGPTAAADVPGPSSHETTKTETSASEAGMPDVALTAPKVASEVGTSLAAHPMREVHRSFSAHEALAAPAATVHASVDRASPESLSLPAVRSSPVKPVASLPSIARSGALSPTLREDTPMGPALADVEPSLRTQHGAQAHADHAGTGTGGAIVDLASSSAAVGSVAPDSVTIARQPQPQPQFDPPHRRALPSARSDTFVHRSADAAPQRSAVQVIPESRGPTSDAEADPTPTAPALSGDVGDVGGIGRARDAAGAGAAAASAGEGTVVDVLAPSHAEDAPGPSTLNVVIASQHEPSYPQRPTAAASAMLVHRAADAARSSHIGGIGGPYASSGEGAIDTPEQRAVNAAASVSHPSMNMAPVVVSRKPVPQPVVAHVPASHSMASFSSSGASGGGLPFASPLQPDVAAVPEGTTTTARMPISPALVLPVSRQGLLNVGAATLVSPSVSSASSASSAHAAPSLPSTPPSTSSPSTPSMPIAARIEPYTAAPVGDARGRGAEATLARAPHVAGPRQVIAQSPAGAIPIVQGESGATSIEALRAVRGDVDVGVDADMPRVNLAHDLAMPDVVVAAKRESTLAAPSQHAEPWATAEVPASPLRQIARASQAAIGMRRSSPVVHGPVDGRRERRDMPLASVQLARSSTARAPMTGTRFEPAAFHPHLVSMRAVESMGNASSPSEDAVHGPLSQDQAAAPETSDTHPDLPLVTAQPLPAIQGRSFGHLDRSPLAQQIDTAPSSPEQAFGVIPVAGEATPSGQQALGQPPAAAAAAAAAGAAGVDMEEVIEKAVQALMLKLEIERERRGFARWI